LGDSAYALLPAFMVRGKGYGRTSRNNMQLIKQVSQL
jgi:hypothetical protein